MSYVVLARKWRPHNFSEMAGQEHVLRALKGALDSGKVHHAFLFTGTRGVGKTTVARILAKSLNCERGVSATPCGECAACREIDEGRFVDLIEVDAASRTKVDDTRELLDNVQYAPTRGRYKVYLIDEVHMLSGHSFNALLKTLEEPPPHVKFLLATTDPQKLPVTVLSRCLQFSLKRLPSTLIAGRLRFIAAAEKMAYDPVALALLARAADGSMRDALSLLDQLVAFGGGALQEADARAMLGTIDRGHVLRMVDALARQDGHGLLAEVREFDRDAPDYDRALVELAAFLQRVAIAQVVPGNVPDDEDFDVQEVARLAALLSPQDVQLYYQIAIGGRRDLTMAPEPRLGFEMTLLRMLAFRPETGEPAAVASAHAAAPVRAAAPRTAPSPAPTPAPPPSVAPPPAAGAGAAAAATPTPAVVAPANVDASNWTAVVEGAQLTGMVRQFALNCVPAGFEGALLTLHLDAAATDRRTRQIEERLSQALTRYFGREIRLAFETDESVTLATPARQRTQADQDRQAAAVAAFEQDPAVRGLRERFGAEPDLASVKPTTP